MFIGNHKECSNVDDVLILPYYLWNVLAQEYLTFSLTIISVEGNQYKFIHKLSW